MAFKTRATRRDDGGYDLSYGKGSHKIADAAQYDETSKRWGCDKLNDTYVKLKDLKAAWTGWAETHYAGQNGVEKPAKGPPAHKPAPKGPPAHKPVEQGVEIEEGVKVEVKVEEWVFPDAYPAESPTGKRYAVHKQKPSSVYEYKHGFAIFDHELKTQVGWAMNEARAHESAEEYNTGVK